MVLEEIRVGNDCIYLMEQLETLHGKNSIGDQFSRNERILTSRDRLEGILEERKDSAKIT